MFSLLTYEMPVANPSLLVSTSLAIAFVTKSTLPVASAGLINTEEEEKSAYALQDLPHCAQ